MLKLEIKDGSGETDGIGLH